MWYLLRASYTREHILYEENTFYSKCTRSSSEVWYLLRASLASAVAFIAASCTHRGTERQREKEKQRKREKERESKRGREREREGESKREKKRQTDAKNTDTLS